MRKAEMKKKCPQWTFIGKLKILGILELNEFYLKN